MERFDVDRITQVLDALDRGEDTVSEDLSAEVYRELRQLAARKLAQHAPGHTLQATALVHEVWLRFDRGGSRQWKSRKHFFVTASKAMGQILIDRARRKLALRRGAGARHIQVDEVDIQAPAKEEALVLMNEALEEFQAIEPDKAEIVRLRYFAGFTEPEIADILNISERTVRRHWRYAKAWLFDRVHPLREG